MRKARVRPRGCGTGARKHCLPDRHSRTCRPKNNLTHDPEDAADPTETSAGGPQASATEPLSSSARGRCPGRSTVGRDRGWGREGSPLPSGRREPAHPSFRPEQTLPAPAGGGASAQPTPSRTPSRTAAPHPAFGAAQSLSVRTWGPAPEAPLFAGRSCLGFPLSPRGHSRGLPSHTGPATRDHRAHLPAPLHKGDSRRLWCPGPHPPAPSPQAHRASLSKP